jgi:phage-related protein
MYYFRTMFMTDAEEFIGNLDAKAIKKLFYDIRQAEQTNDPKLFKKLRNDIWQFRVRYMFGHIRILTFWDKIDKEDTLVVATHGFIKKVDKIPGNEIERAINLKNRYFESQ